MFVSSFVHCTAVLIFQLWEVQTLSPIPACPASCACDETLLVNCSSLGLPKAPSHIPATASALDLSHNALHSLAPLASGHMYLRGLQHLWVGNNSLESLSMCSGIWGVVGTRTLTRRNTRCVSWAPDLQSLSADRNHLKYLITGLGKMKSLKVLQLSHNKISEIGPADLTGCTHLNELHLQYNLINTIHPEAFKGLQKLKVLDVSHNLLVAIPVPAYWSLRNLNVLVDISGNRWRCDCSLKTIRRWLSFDSELGGPTWKMVCFSPSHHAGKHLLYLEESDLTCPQPVYSTPGVRKEVALDEGMEFILSCSTANQDFLHIRWWTPHGQISDSQRFLHITNITERDAGLYVCVSGYHQDHMSVFSLHVHKRAHDRRLRREAQIGLVEFNAEATHNIQTNVPAVRAVQQSQFVLAVCLSVFITFIVAFVLGVILRPFLEKWYKQIRYKKKSTTSPQNSRTSSTAQTPYVNEGYLDTDDQKQQVHEGPRVTFGGVTEIPEQGSVPHYVTIEGSPHGSNTDVAALHENTDRALEKNIEVLKEVPLREENKEMTRTGPIVSLNAENSNEMQLEYIPDPEDTAELEEGSISPVSFLSGEQQESQMSYEEKKSIEQSVDFPTVSTDQEEAIPRFITGPFPLKITESKEEGVDELDPDLWNDSGESFSFTEGSPRSSSCASHVSASDQPPFQKEMSVDESSDRPGSCNSNESGESKGGSTKYTINSEDDKGTRLRQDTITLDPTDIHMTYIRGDSFDDELFTEYKEFFPSSNISTAYEEPAQYNVHPVYRTSLKTAKLVRDERSRTNSCSEKVDEQGDHPWNIEMKSQLVRSHVGSSLDDSIFGTIDQTLYPIPRIKQYLYFSQSISLIQAPLHPTEEETIPNKVVKTESKNFSSEDDNFVQIDASLDVLPKVKQYIQFSPSGSQLSYGLSAAPTPSESIHQVARPVVVSKMDSPSDPISIFYMGQNISLQTMPKVQRHVQFWQSEPQSLNEHTPTIQGGSLFEQIPISFDEVPKVKHYVQFSPFKSHLSNDSVHSESIPQVARPVVVSKTELPSDTINILYKGQNTSLQTIPKVQRYIQFRQSEPQTVQEYTSAIQESSLFEQIPIPFDEVPKVKPYVQFSHSESKLSTDTVHQYITTPETVSKTEFPSDKINVFYKGQTISLSAMPKVQRYLQFRQFEPQTLHTPDAQASSLFRQIPISFDEVPKVKRHILFSQSTQISLPYSKKKYSLNDEQITHEIKTPMVTSKPQNAGDNFFVQTGTCLDGLPKVKRYIQFAQFKVTLETHFSPNFTINETMTEGKLVKRNKSLSNNGDPVDEHSFFKQAGVFFDGIPKVRRRIQFKEHPPQLPVSQPLSTLKQPMTPTLILDTKSSQSKTNFFGVIQVSLENIPKVNRSLQFTQVEAKPSIQSIPSFSGKTHTPFDKVPKVKRYLQFLKSEPQPSSWPPSSPSKITDTVPPAFSTKMQTIRSEEKGRPTLEGDDFFGQTVSTFNDLSKVKRHIQFTQAQPRLQPPLLHSYSNRTEKTLHARPDLKAKDLTSGDYIQPAADEHIILGPIGASFEIPQVKRHIQFTQTEPHLQPTLLHSLSNRTDKTIHASPELKANDLTGKHNTLGPIGASFEIPKVRRYIQFSPSSTQPSSLSSHQQTARPELWQSSSSIAEDIFFKKMDSSELPKVNRYIQFTHKHSTQSKSPNNSGVTNDVTKKAEFWGSDLSRVEIKTPVTEDNVFGQLGTNLNSLPRVNRHVKFIQSRPDPSHQSQSQTEKMTQKEWKTVNSRVDIDAKLSTKDTLFDGVFETFYNIPKVKKSILFTQSKTQNSNLTEVQQIVIPQLVPKTESVGPSSKSDEDGIPKKEDNYLGQLGVLLDDVPKVKKYVQFSQSEAFVPTQSSLNIKDHCSLLFSNAEIVTPVLATKTESNSADYSSEIKYRTDTEFNEFPNVKRYLQFTKSAPEPSGQSPLTSATTGAVSTAFSTKMQTTRSKDKGSHPIKGEVFFSQTVSSFKELPKVKRHIQFTQTEPPLLHSLSNRTDKTIHASSELKIKDLASEDYIQSAASKHNFLGPIGASFEIPKVRGYIQFSKSQTQTPTEKMTKKGSPFTQSEYQRKTAAGDASSNYANTIFGSLDVSFNQLPTVKTNVQIAQSEPCLSTEEVFKRTTKKNDLFGQTDGVPRLIRYRQHRQSERHTQSLSPYNSYQKWKTINEESTELRMFKTNVTPESAQDLSQIQEALSAVRVTTETSRFHQRSPFLLDSDVYKQPVVEELSIQTSSNSLSGGKKHANTQGLSSRTALSITESETTLESKLSGLGASSNETDALQTRKPLVLDPALQDVSQYITDKPAASPGNDDAREYLRDSSLARQRQERRRMLFQQKRRAMDGSFTSQENDQ